MGYVPGRFDREGAEHMDRIAKTVFAPVYPVLAEQILIRCGFSRGRCLDVGSGPGSLGIALAQASDLAVTLLDSSPDMLAIAEENVREAGLSDRVSPLRGDVHDIPLPAGSVDLVVSRGSVFFWEDLSRAFSEIYRVLAPGGRTYVGGGFGTAELRDAVAAAMTKENADWKSFRDKNLGPDNRERVAGVLADLGLHHRIINDDSGLWVVIERGR
ncbi:class I SAM-dependent methyltransferase [Methanoculleus sp. DTU007]|jgi:SAM-dependent methyltransferase|uniref:class I SAM-dependent methyltransferase n=1 Tax=Methanoculleus sp. DTU007 TaxID=1671626 RepID=UPI000AF1491D|nr:class I SAM-dependent methyltransferase [Methanoculleus sp. DTU007]HQD25152.1 class I SAM-dependent methyltransferase [Methanoculleus thermophilus]